MKIALTIEQRALHTSETARLSTNCQVLMGALQEFNKGTAKSPPSHKTTSYRRCFWHKPSQSHCGGQQTGGEPSVSDTAQRSPLGRGGSADTGLPCPRCRKPLCWKNTKSRTAVKKGDTFHHGAKETHQFIGGAAVSTLMQLLGLKTCLIYNIMYAQLLAMNQEDRIGRCQGYRA